MRSRRHIGAIALSSVLAAASAAASPRAPGAQPATLAERLDLTRITVLEADYARAAEHQDTSGLAAYERELVTMLRDEILPHAPPDGALSGATAGGTGGGAAAPRRGTAETAAVAVDEEEVGAASLDAKVAELAREFISLEGNLDRASVARKTSLLGALRAISTRAQFPGTGPSVERSREERQRAGQERRERQGFENLPVE